ncbi:MULTISPECIES: glutamate-5-semialdehyde dehydrogenase [unclassified Gilliamella]|uniref:glutamate-5-semialdehyde dehydrogenase n=1 Tax=unclassified Gilliamella TaxID=2685620 RepID=UPI00226AD260|nr:MULTISPECIES: glutamate-5-semialdehyde dehydrogenase [unclassified Gilliamella]MCX8641724.1 glutamate-5-semialdehyde dehydrogenase [Gilliamella sp. B3835]MCX8706525.1 glutamate-5-semialdehyde dehydrogenase [Gilliamella sp. B3783]MCX8709005.1 glutamate-5-semialdehyde dehydrogenase [Gilliamella sp. B3780]MCX8714505.1 glutamate-5-semialdehyde dehydrogenase [Gilliamella sp. B3781]MCX8715871.1 glutamate-5-semialdehyde dehydrogenase [Gilliamella sp. B3784]
MLQQMGKDAKQASYQLSQCPTAIKNKVLSSIADLLEKNSTIILNANKKDIELAKQQELSEALLDRLLLTPERLASIANDVRKVELLTDPIGQIIDGSTLENGLKLQRHRVPLGVIGVIYEARPNVTIDIAALCLKTGNATILRGGKETIHTNTAIIAILQQALEQVGLPKTAIQFIDNPDRKYINELLKLDRYVDMIIPRGGSALHKLCREHSTIPVITGGIGVCHMFMDESMDFDCAFPIIINAKTQRPSTCNTLETLLVHTNIADTFLPKLSQIMADNNVILHADVDAFKILETGVANVFPVEDAELRQEWLSKDLNIVIVDSLTMAVEHIREYGSGHSEAILTRDLANAEQFVNLVDAAAVYVNASTRFTDGGQFGLGAEVAVSTQKLHARGPMGLEALTTYKWIAFGDDLIRQ